MHHVLATEIAHILFNRLCKINCFCENIVQMYCRAPFPLLLFRMGMLLCNQTELNQNRAVRVLTESSINAHSGPIINSLCWKTVRELVDEESKLIVYKSISGLAPKYLYNLLKRKFFGICYGLRNTATDLKIQKKTSQTGQNRSHIEGRNSGIAY